MDRTEEFTNLSKLFHTNDGDDNKNSDECMTLAKSENNDTELSDFMKISVNIVSMMESNEELVRRMEKL